MDNQTTSQPPVITTPSPQIQTSPPPVTPAPQTTVTDSDTPAPKPPKKSIFSKLLLIVLIIVVLFGIGYIGIYGYLNTQVDKVTKVNTPTIKPSPSVTPEPTADWKMYRNEELEFTFQYPKDYILNEEGYFYPSHLKEGLRAANTEVGSINIALDKAITNCQIKYELVDLPKVVSRENITIHDISGMKELVETYYLGDNGEGYGLLYINNFCFNKNGKEFTVSFFTYNKPSNDNNKEFNQILSTFQSTETDTPTCTPRPACLDATPKCMIAETSEICPSNSPTSSKDTTVCTMEAKQCPDGSYVSRTGPNCEFAACPE